MAVDSIRRIESLQRIHSRLSGTGKLYKGQGITAASASIPSKYQTIVTDNSDNKGFSSKSKRFSDDYYINEIPGPGSYAVAHGKIENISTSYSKKGTGSFASKTKRSVRGHGSGNPGAGTYNLPSLLTTRKEFNQANSSSFHTPIALKTDDFLVGRERAPAPNNYQVNDTSVTKNYGVAAEAAFRSKTKRQGMAVGSIKNPSPSHYNISEKLTKPNTKALTSMFSSGTRRDLLQKPNPVPGPGTYKPHIPVTPPKKLILPRKHYLCISAPAMPLPPPVDVPGPGAYELVDYEGPPKHYMSSGVFVSNSSRWAFNQLPSKDQPGPATYKPERVGKQSFIYNAQSRWIPG